MLGPCRVLERHNNRCKALTDVVTEDNEDRRPREEISCSVVRSLAAGGQILGNIKAPKPSASQPFPDLGLHWEKAADKTPTNTEPHARGGESVLPNPRYHEPSFHQPHPHDLRSPRPWSFPSGKVDGPHLIGAIGEENVTMIVGSTVSLCSG